jgi:hypothetical protein
VPVVRARKALSGRPAFPGPPDIIHYWSSYRVITFDAARSDLPPYNGRTVSEIASMSKNPSIQLDSYRDPTTSDQCVGTVHDVLIVAGIPSNKKEADAFSGPNPARTRCMK